MRSRTTARFRKCFSNLPNDVPEQARAAYRHFLKNPSHPSLRFKPVHPTMPVYSVRVGKAYRALGRRDEAGVVWFWIGSHADYDKLLAQI